MKKFLSLSLCLLSAWVAMAQTTTEKLAHSIYLKNGVTVSFDYNQLDSTRIIYTPEGDSLGIKVYVRGKESADYLYSQIKYVVFWGDGEVAGENLNRNNEADLAKNKEGWRLEFPRFYQGSNRTFEISHYSDVAGVNYSLEWDGDKRANRWTCYEMYDKVLQKAVGRNDNFREDSLIDADCRTTLNDYKNTGYSRGHLCPSYDRLCSRESNDQTFYLSNMQPQNQDHNGGVWANLETKVHDVWSSICDTLYVVKAATIDNEDQILGYTSKNNGEDSDSYFHMIIPKYFYMALLAYNKELNSYDALGIWSPHQGNSTTEYITIDELERRTGIDFFCNLPDAIERQVEATVDEDYWSVKVSQ